MRSSDDLARERLEGVSGLRGPQLGDGLHCALTVHLSKTPSLLYTLRASYKRHGLVYVSRRLELARDERHQLGILLGGEEDGRGGETRLEVGEGSLADGLQGPLEVERVVHQLERLAHVCAVQVAGALVRPLVSAQHRGGQTTVAHERRRLVEVLTTHAVHGVIQTSRYQQGQGTDRR